MTTACGAKKTFAPAPFTRSRNAHVVCSLPTGHKGTHEAVRGSTAFCWRDEPASDLAPEAEQALQNIRRDIRAWV